MNLKPFSVFRVLWADIELQARSIIPALTFADHKGSMGRIGVLGGSKDYTGAPFYASSAALKFGADLSYVFTSEEAALPIKSYSPELMVTAVYRDHLVDDQQPVHVQQQEVERAAEIVQSFLPRLHVLLIGPGLGRRPQVMDMVSRIVGAARRAGLPMVIDADGLWWAAQNLSLLHGSLCLLTPNAAELDRLLAAAKAALSSAALPAEHAEELLQDLASDSLQVRVRALSVALGRVTILVKGQADLLTDGSDVYLLEDRGSPRRCGGQGDLLAGSVAVALHWSHRRGGAVEGLGLCAEGLRREEELSAVPSAAGPNGLLAGLLAASVIKAAGRMAFAERGRSMTSPDVLDKVGAAFASLDAPTTPS